MTLPASEPPVAPAAALKLWPLQVANLCGAMAMMAFVALIGPVARLLGLAPWQAGAAVTAGALLWMLLSRRWGMYSDRLGRRPVLLAGTLGFMLSYWAMCLAMDVSLRTLPDPWLAFAALVITRAAVGACYAALPTTGIALVADHYPPQQRAGAIATVGAANAVGVVLGPALAGLLAPFSLSLPLYLTMLLPAISLLALWHGLPRTGPTQAVPRAPMRLTDPRLRRPIAVAFTAMFCVGSAQIAVGFFALDRLGLTATDATRAAGLALASVGLALGISQSLVRQLKWPPARLIRLGGSVAAVGFSSAALADHTAMLCGSYFVAALGMGWVFPGFSALAANAVQPQEQGSAAGSVGAMQGLGMVAGPLAGATLYAVTPGLPYVVVGLMLATMAWWPSRQPADSPDAG